MDFKSIANKRLEDVVRPPNPPIGTYTWQVSKMPIIETSKDEKWDFVTFPIRAVAAGEDVDPDELAAYGDVNKIVQSIKFIFDKQDKTAFEKTEFRLRTFLESHLKCCGPDDTMGQALNASVGAQCLGVLSWRPSKDNPEDMFTDVGKTSPLV